MAKEIVAFGHQTFFGHIAYLLAEEKRRAEHEKNEKERERAEKERERAGKERAKAKTERVLRWIEAQGLHYEVSEVESEDEDEDEVQAGAAAVGPRSGSRH